MERSTLHLIAPKTKNSLFYMDEETYFNLLTLVIKKNKRRPIDNIVIRADKEKPLKWIIKCLKYFEDNDYEEQFTLELWLNVNKISLIYYDLIFKLSEDAGVDTVKFSEEIALKTIETYVKKFDLRQGLLQNTPIIYPYKEEYLSYNPNINNLCTINNSEDGRTSY